MIAYETLFTRRSVRKFEKGAHVSPEELAALEEFFTRLEPLFPDIKTAFRIVRREETDCRWGEYAVLLFCEKKEGYLENIGYMGQQIDLWLTENCLGSCWYGMASSKTPPPEDMDFAILLSFGKSGVDDFRKSREEFQRKDLSKTLEGQASGPLLSALEDARFAPSACNSQPWRVTVDGNCLSVCRKSDSPLAKVVKKLALYYNRMDIGIYLYFLERALRAHGLAFTRQDPQGGEGPFLYRIDE